MGVMAKRMTQLTVLPDIGAAVRRYQALGFEPAESGHAECVGMLTGKTGVLLVTTAFTAHEFGRDVAERIENETFPYIYVESVDESLAALPAGAEILKDVTLGYGTREVLVRDEAGFMILAETAAD